MPKINWFIIHCVHQYRKTHKRSYSCPYYVWGYINKNGEIYDVPGCNCTGKFVHKKSKAQDTCKKGVMFIK